MKKSEDERKLAMSDGFDDLFTTVKAELNFLRLPYFATCKSAKNPFLELIETVERNGVHKRIEWRVVPDPRLGLPGAMERNVMLWILKRADEARPSANAPVPDPIDIGSLYSICAELGINDDGRTRLRIKNAVRKLGRTNCISQGAYYHKATGTFVESGKAFSFLQEWAFTGEQFNGEIVESNFVSIHPLIRQNLDAFYVKSLDWALLRSLEVEIAALLYPHLSCVFHGMRKDQEYIELAYFWLAQRLGIKVWGDLREAKKQLKAAHNELINNGYLSKVKWVQDKIQYFPGIRAEVEIARQRKRKRAASVKRPGGSRQLVIPSLELLAKEVDQRTTEIARQAARLKLGKPLTTERLALFDITPDEVHAWAALEKSKE